MLATAFTAVCWTHALLQCSAPPPSCMRSNVKTCMHRDGSVYTDVVYTLTSCTVCERPPCSSSAPVGPALHTRAKDTPCNASAGIWIRQACPATMPANASICADRWALPENPEKLACTICRPASVHCAQAQAATATTHVIVTGSVVRCRPWHDRSSFCWKVGEAL